MSSSSVSWLGLVRAKVCAQSQWDILLGWELGNSQRPLFMWPNRHLELIYTTGVMWGTLWSLAVAGDLDTAVCLSPGFDLGAVWLQLSSTAREKEILVNVPSRVAGNSLGISHSCPKQGSIWMTWVSLCGYRMPVNTDWQHRQFNFCIGCHTVKWGKFCTLIKTKGCWQVHHSAVHLPQFQGCLFLASLYLMLSSSAPVTRQPGKHRHPRVTAAEAVHSTAVTDTQDFLERHSNRVSMSVEK
jgi:hypothetical protein